MFVVDVAVLFVSVSVLDTVGIVTHSTAITPALTRESVVSLAFPISSDPTPRV